MKLYLRIAYTPNINAHTAKTVKFWSIGAPGGGGGPEAACCGCGGAGAATTLVAVIKTKQHVKKIVFVIFISLNLSETSDIKLDLGSFMKFRTSLILKELYPTNVEDFYKNTTLKTKKAS